MNHFSKRVLLVLEAILLTNALISCDKSEEQTNVPIIINSISPASGYVGETVTIEGINFSPAKSDNIVKFNGVVAQVLTVTSTKITTIVPENSTTGKVSIEVGNSIVVYDDEFIVLSKEVNESYCSPQPSGQLIDSAPRFAWTKFVNEKDDFILLNDFNGNGDPEPGSSEIHYYDLSESHVAAFNSGEPYKLELGQSSWKWTPVVAYFKAWIDYNANTEFEESEVIASTTIPNTNFQHFDFTVPDGFSGNITRMRIIISNDVISNPCIVPVKGEVADYTATIE